MASECFDGDAPDYRIASFFQAHEDDVKQVVATSVGRYISCSRDRTIRIWNRSIYQRGFAEPVTTLFPMPPQDINSVAFVDYKGNGYVFAGKKDGSILVYENDDSEPSIILRAHTSNVCTLHVNREFGFLASGGWDHNVFVYSLDGILSGNTGDYITLRGHTQSVWSIDSFKDVPDVILTASADRKVCMWKHDQLINIYTGHDDIVRSVVCLDNGHFVTGCNDGKIRLYHKDKLSPLEMRSTSTQQFIFSMALISFNKADQNVDFLAVGSEGGSLEILAFGPGHSLMGSNIIQLPVQTIWSVATTCERDLIVAGADGWLYLYTWSKDRALKPSDAGMSQFGSKMDVFLKGRAELEAKYQEQQAGNIIEVTIHPDDSGRALKFRYDKTTDLHARAEDFCREHGLLMSSVPEIVQFVQAHINQNHAANVVSKGYIQKPTDESILFKTYFTYGAAVNSVGVEKLAFNNGLQDNNVKLDAEELASLQAIMQNPQNAVVPAQFEAINKALQWPIQDNQILPCLDALRAGFSNAKFSSDFCRRFGAATLQRLLTILISEPHNNIQLLVCRCLTNMCFSKEGRDLIKSEMQHLCELILRTLQTTSNNLQQACCHLLGNVSFMLRNQDVVELGPREDVLRVVIKAFESGFNFDVLGEASLVLVLQALVTLMSGDVTVIKLAKNRQLLPFINIMKDKVTTDDGKYVARTIADLIHSV